MNDAPEIASKSYLKKMINNRDYSVLINYSPPMRVLTLEHSNQMFNHDLRLLEIRAVLLSCIYYCAQMVKNCNTQDNQFLSSKVNGLYSNDESLKSDKLELHLKKLKNLYYELESNHPIPIPKSVFGSYFGSKLFGLEKSKIMLNIIIHFIEFVQTMGLSVNNFACMGDDWINKMKVNATELINDFENAHSFCQCVTLKTTNEIDSSLKLEGRKEVLEILTNMIDVSCICI